MEKSPLTAVERRRVKEAKTDPKVRKSRSIQKRQRSEEQEDRNM
jgi:hypothetical protein